MSKWGMFFAVCGIAFAGGMALCAGSLGVMALSEGVGTVVLNIGAGVCTIGFGGALLGGMVYVPYKVIDGIQQSGKEPEWNRRRCRN